MSQFGAFDPQLVLMDITLPFFNGYYWCGRIRQVSKVPIIFISSAADNMNIIMAVNMGADDFIAKPFDMSVLMAKINAMLRRIYDFTRASPVLEHRGAVLNTGDNALKYTREGSISIYLEEPVTLCIRDTGIGIAAEDLPRIFEKSFTGCQGRADHRASGIGLYLCKQICDRLGHTIRAESKVGEGTVIRIGLEQTRAEAE